MALVAVTVTHVAWRYLAARSHVTRRAAVADRLLDGAIWGVEWVSEAVSGVVDSAIKEEG